ncbi:hypothetical protein [Aquibacillus saliphilus]|uniref:hypothetical protein n=1 Tax=Aquibacillus saliphilus TaxID=1909422 RepID=UPI001CF0A01C|nr:hypothetical protein [Aquibacillus saliphilus]
MGYFDDIANRSYEEDEIKEIESEIVSLYRQYLQEFRMLERSPLYQSRHKEAMDQGINDFTNFFEGKGLKTIFQKQSNFDNVTVFAKKEDIVAELQIHNNEFILNLPKKLYESIVVEDNNSGTPNFNGIVSKNGDIQLLNRFDEKDKLSVYKKAVENIKKDIQIVQKKVEDNYEPDFIYYLAERQDYVKSIREFLGILNQELK